MSPKVWLVFSKPESPFVYHAGETLEAKLCVEIEAGSGKDGNLNGREIVVVIKGKSKCNWSEGRHEKRGEEEFFRQEFRTNLGGSRNDATPLLPPGIHNFQLKFRLPPDLPCTFKGSKGSVHYEAKVKMCPAGLLEFCKADRYPFEVLGQLDTSTVVDLNQPAELEDCWGVWEPFGSGCCCRFSKISCKISLPRTGVLYGERIPVSVEIGNQSRKSVRQIFVQLMQEVNYTANHNWNVKCKKMSELSKVMVEPPEEAKVKGPCQFICGQEIQIPDSAKPITSSGRCTIIKISYLLRFTVKLGCFYTMTKVMPITIGNVVNKDKDRHDDQNKDEGHCGSSCEELVATSERIGKVENN